MCVKILLCRQPSFKLISTTHFFCKGSTEENLISASMGSSHPSRPLFFSVTPKVTSPRAPWHTTSPPQKSRHTWRECTPKSTLSTTTHPKECTALQSWSSLYMQINRQRKDYLPSYATKRKGDLRSGCWMGSTRWVLHGSIDRSDLACSTLVSSHPEATCPYFSHPLF